MCLNEHSYLFTSILKPYVGYESTCFYTIFFWIFNIPFFINDSNFYFYLKNLEVLQSTNTQIEEFLKHTPAFSAMANSINQNYTIATKKKCKLLWVLQPKSVMRIWSIIIRIFYIGSAKHDRFLPWSIPGNFE